MAYAYNNFVGFAEKLFDTLGLMTTPSPVRGIFIFSMVALAINWMRPGFLFDGASPKKFAGFPIWLILSIIPGAFVTLAI